MRRTAIISDIHGNSVALDAVLADIDSQNVQRIVCLGDVIGYGPHPEMCLDRVAEMDFCILGNHDSSALFDPEGFNRAAESAIFWTRNRIQHSDDGGESARRRMQFICQLPRMVVEDDVWFVHGSPRAPTNEYVFPEDAQNPKKLDKLFGVVRRLCFQGHTHVPGVFTTGGQFLTPDTQPDDGYDLSPGESADKFMVNVGSVGQPRDGDPRSCYAIVDGDRLFFRRVEYDIESIVRAIEAEPDLDNLLGYRLRDGR